MIIPHSRPFIDREDIEAVTRALVSGNLVQGENVREFEGALASYVGVRHGVACSSGTSALHLALLCLGIGEGDEVIMPSYVCSAPYFATLHTGAIPKVVDINIVDFNINVESLKEKLTPNTKAIIAPHMFGTPAEIEGLLDLGVPIIEDCAQSLGAEYEGQKTGSFGALSVFSFYATKMIAAGEGGMVLTDNPDFCSRITDLRDYDKKSIAPMRYNYKMTDFQAALGLAQLKKLPYFVERRKEIASSYTERFSGCDVVLPQMFSNKKSVFYRYVIRVANLEHVRNEARKKGIVCERPVFQPLHIGLSMRGFPASDRANGEALSVPLYPSLSEDEIKYLLAVFSGIFRSEIGSAV